MTNYRKGSMGDWEKKNNWKWKLAMSVATLLVMLCFHAFDTDMRAMTQRAGSVARTLGLLFFFAGIAAVWLDEFFVSLGEKTGWTHGAGWGGGTLLGCLVSTGFNFDYFGL